MGLCCTPELEEPEVVWGSLLMGPKEIIGCDCDAYLICYAGDGSLNYIFR